MTDSSLAKLASAAGINIHWVDAFGDPQQVSPETQRLILAKLGYPADSEEQIRSSQQTLIEGNGHNMLPPLITHDEAVPLLLGRHGLSRETLGCRFRIVLENGEIITGIVDSQGTLPPLPSGYHELQIQNDQHVLAVAPHSCPSLRAVGDNSHSENRARLWGLTVQLHALRRPETHGVGDAGAVEALAVSAAAKGADALAISPVHAVSAAGFDNYSPYSPSSRLFLNAIHAAPDRILGSGAVERAIDQCQLRDELQRLEKLPLIDWAAVFHAHSRLLRQLHRTFIGEQGALVTDFNAFVAAHGSALQDHCRFEAIHEHMRLAGKSGDWRDWPESLRHPGYSAVQAFAAEHIDDISYHAFCQWLTSRSLERAQNTAVNAGMRVGLISDLAVGAVGGGSQTWSRQEEFLSGLSVGAPPDIVNRQGQNWHISAFSPTGMRRHGFRAYIEMLRANLAYSGGIRIDHVMGLRRLWVVPDDHTADQGAYLDYPVEDLLRLLTLEAWRHQALVIGEDLGTVPEGFREELASRNILGMRVLFFEQEDNRFIAAARWPRSVMATTTTHDLPTTKGWFLGRDIDWRVKAGHSSADAAVGEHQQRREDNLALIAALHAGDHLDNEDRHADSTLDACLRFVASTPSCLALLPLEDLMASEEQPNLPGPGDVHPNWRRRWDMDAQAMLERADVSTRAAQVDALRQGCAAQAASGTLAAGNARRQGNV